MKLVATVPRLAGIASVTSRKINAVVDSTGKSLRMSVGSAICASQVSLSDRNGGKEKVMVIRSEAGTCEGWGLRESMEEFRAGYGGGIYGNMKTKGVYLGSQVRI